MPSARLGRANWLDANPTKYESKAYREGRRMHTFSAIFAIQGQSLIKQ